MTENMPQNPQIQEDLLETLLAGAAEHAAKAQMDELAKKGTVTKAEFSTALSQFERNLLEKIDSVLGEKLQKATPSATESNGESEEEEEQGKPVQKAGRRGTITSPADPRSDNPVRYLVQKGRKGEDFEDIDKALMWELTRKGFLQGMSMQEIDGPDFGDDNL